VNKSYHTKKDYTVAGTQLHSQEVWGMNSAVHRHANIDHFQVCN